VVDFSLGECTFCADCAKACHSGALCRGTVAQAWDLRAAVGDRCIALQGVVCGSCADACGPAAIRLAPALGGVARPSLAGERCSGCGACFGVCPSNAIEMKPAPVPAPA
jgi:ferredoxin-type protein NapF